MVVKNLFSYSYFNRPSVHLQQLKAMQSFELPYVCESGTICS